MAASVGKPARTPPRPRPEPPRTLAWDRALRARLGEAAGTAWPREACGLLGGSRSGTAVRIARFAALPNHAATRDRFRIAPADFVAAVAAMADAGAPFLGFWHSHPDGAAALSAADLSELWPDCVQVVVGARPGRPTALGAYWLAGGATPPRRLWWQP